MCFYGNVNCYSSKSEKWAKLSVCLINWALCHEAIFRNESIDLQFLTWTPDGVERSDLLLHSFNLEKTAPYTLDKRLSRSHGRFRSFGWEKHLFSLPGIELLPCSQSLYCLSYPELVTKQSENILWIILLNSKWNYKREAGIPIEIIPSDVGPGTRWTQNLCHSCKQPVNL
jgi:hypothetical protein